MLSNCMGAGGSKGAPAGSPEAILRGGAGFTSKFTNNTAQHPMDEIIDVVWFRTVGNGSKFQIVLKNGWEHSAIVWYAVALDRNGRRWIEHVEWNRHGVKDGGGRWRTAPGPLPSNWYGINGLYELPTHVWVKLMWANSGAVLAIGDIVGHFQSVPDILEGALLAPHDDTKESTG